MFGGRNIFLKTAIIVMLVFILSQVVAAKEPFEIKIIPIKDKINSGEDASYNISIINNQDAKDEFRIYILAYPLWEIRTVPLQNPIQIEVPSKSSRAVQIFLNPQYVTAVGNYQVDLYVEAISLEKTISSPLEMRINSDEPRIEGYVPTVSLNLEMPKKIDPREKIRIRIGLSNQNNLDYPEIKVFVNSKLINDEIKDSLAPQEDKTIQLLKDIPPNTHPQTDKVIVTLMRGNRTLETKSQSIEILGYSTIVKESVTLKSFLKTVNKVKFTNVGNIPSSEPLKVNTTSLRALFTVPKPKPYSLNGDSQRVFVWDMSIPPMESYEVSTTESYRALFMVIVLGIAFVVVYFMYRSPMIFRKSVTNILKSHGGISQMQISLALRNRGNATMHNIEVIDIIPVLVNLETGLLIGTLHPSKIEKKEKIGTIVKWDIKSIDTGEERVITYKVSSKLSILGGITLPIANCKFLYQSKLQNGKSNVLDVKI